ncbi:Ketosteroid isomerase homolog [uncultured Defluviicoccus sp.]|nr:Ketosteroid isomerase homolog [uncultured Defluviicoccus sp.]
MGRSLLSDDAAVLFANDAFYTAIAGRDFAAMERLWSERPAVSCIHPGWPPIASRQEVMESWHAILTGQHAPEIVWRNARAYLLGETAYVICYEILKGTTLVATNVFVREAGQWRMAHHQAGAAPPVSLPDDTPARLQ